MPNYDFTKDLPVAIKTEKEIARLIEKFYGWRTIYFSRSKGYDLLLQKGKLLRKIEIKEDFSCEKTGNVGLEFECRGKPSGIRTSIASHYIYKVHTPDGSVRFLVIRKTILEKMIKSKKFFRIVTGGDPGSQSKNFLFRLDVFQKYAVEIFKQTKDITGEENEVLGKTASV